MLSGIVLISPAQSQNRELERIVFGHWWESVARIKLPAIAAFFRAFDLDEVQLAAIVVSWMLILSERVLSLDRTTWQFGRDWHNILTLGVVHQGVAFSVL